MRRGVNASSFTGLINCNSRSIQKQQHIIMPTRHFKLGYYYTEQLYHTAAKPIIRLLYSSSWLFKTFENSPGCWPYNTWTFQLLTIYYLLIKNLLSTFWWLSKYHNVELISSLCTHAWMILSLFHEFFVKYRNKSISRKKIPSV